MDMLPLVKRLIFTTILTIPILSLVTASEVLICSHLQYGHPSSLLKAFYPLLALEGLAILECILLRTRSTLGGLSWTLVLLSTITLVAKYSHQLPIIADAPWWVACIPLWSLSLLFLLMVAYIITCGCVGHYLLTPRHIMCLVLYVISLLLCTSSSILFCFDFIITLFEETLIPVEHRLYHFHVILPSMLLFVGLGVAIIAVGLVLDDGVDHLVITYGYEAPLPLSCTAEGWEPTGAGVTYWLLLGRIEVAAGGRKARGSKSSIPESPSGGAYSSFDARGMVRTNSGSYLNLYEEV